MVTMRIAALFVISLIFFSCQAMPSLVKPPLEKEGRVFVYLTAFPQEADRLTFRLKEISAVRGDGTKVSLPLHFEEITGKDLKRDRLLATGNLPPGQYTGFAFAASDATLQGQEGIITLPVADETAITSFNYSIARKKALVIYLEFRYKDSLLVGFRFTPSFSAEIPEKSASGRIGLIASRAANIVTVFDKVSGKVIAVVPTGASPSEMVLNPIRFRAYVAVSGEDAIEVIDLLASEVIDRGQLVIGDRPEGLALTPDRNTILSANAGSDTVSFIDASSLIETTRIKVGIGPQSILIDRAGQRAYVFNTLSNTISVLDIGRKELVSTFATDAGPVRGDFNRSGNRLYVLHQFSPYLSVFDPRTLSVVERVYVGHGGTAVKVDSLTDLIYLTRRATGEISVYDPFSFLPIDSYRISGDASYFTIDGEGNNLCIVLPSSGSVKTVQLIGKRTVYETEVGEDPYWVTLMGER